LNALLLACQAKTPAGLLEFDILTRGVAPCCIDSLLAENGAGSSGRKHCSTKI